MGVDNLFPCDICEKSFKKKYHLIRHTRIYTREKPYECEICKKAFSSSSSLTYHKSVHTGVKIQM